MRTHGFAALLLTSMFGAAPGCGDDAAPLPAVVSGADGAVPDLRCAGDDRPRAAGTPSDPNAPDAGPSACAPTETRQLVASCNHVADDRVAVTYTSNPPSSGDHCPAWPRWGVYTKSVVPRCNYIHGLEHGAIAVLYNCPTGCPTVVDELRRLVGSFRERCTPARVVLTADPKLPAGVQVAAASWGWTFTATCLDEGARAALLRFMRDHVDRGREPFCDDGSYGTPD